MAWPATTAAQANFAARDDLGKAHIHPLGKRWVVFNHRPPTEHRRGVDIIHPQHRMRVAHRHRRDVGAVA